jgi:D-arabinose 1-dehydrogenase-like Zn-dependent alcohol dehydrogenase
MRLPASRRDAPPADELINIEEVNGASGKVGKGDVRFRYVIDMASLDAVK